MSGACATRVGELPMILPSGGSDVCYLWADDEGSDKQLASKKDVCKLTARQQTIMELLQTESNYVSIIHTILTVCYLSSTAAALRMSDGWNW